MRRDITLVRLAAGLTILMISALAGGCAPTPPYTPTPTRTPDAVALLTGTADSAPPVQLSATLPAPTVEPTQIETPTPTATLTNGEMFSLDHNWLSRPLPNDAEHTYLDRTYPYGSTSNGKLRPHTGGDFFNPEGTPVLAAADGVVVVAGTDAETLYGPESNFYGNLIILEHPDLTYVGQTVYTLYGHLSRIEVAVGDPVTVGQEIGRVGGTGIANGGSHLHLEVRLGDPLDYMTATRNPDLWLEPYPGYGTLAGRVTSADGELVRGVSLTVENEERIFFLTTYEGEENQPDDLLGENFTYGDIPVGTYTVSVVNDITGKLYRQQVTILDGRTTWVAFQFE